MMMTVDPPVVQPSLGLIALMHGMAEDGYRPGYSARNVNSALKQRRKEHGLSLGLIFTSKITLTSVQVGLYARERKYLS